MASQLLYLFSGMEPADGQTILQPVLQWGDYGPDEDGVHRTGQFWTVASWMVGGPTNSATHTTHIRVSSGDVLIGVITLMSQTRAGFVYSCEFEGLAGSKLQTPVMQELVWCAETLEAYELEGRHIVPYDLDSGSEYPAAEAIAFRNIKVVTGATGPSAGWQKQDVVSKYGEYTSIARDTTVDGEVNIHFRPTDAAPPLIT